MYGVELSYLPLCIAIEFLYSYIRSLTNSPPFPRRKEATPAAIHPNSTSTLSLPILRYSISASNISLYYRAKGPGSSSAS